MKKALTVVMVIVVGMLIGLWIQSRSLRYGDFSWVCVRFAPFTGKSMHVVCYDKEVLCARVLDVGEDPWVRANADRTLSVSYGQVGHETTVHYSIESKDYVAARDCEVFGYDLNFSTLSNGAADLTFGREVRAFSRRMEAWERLN